MSTAALRRTPGWLIALRALLVVILVLAAIIMGLVAFAPAPAVAARHVPLADPDAPPPSIDWPQSRSAAYGIVGIEDSVRSTGSADAHPMASVTKIVTVLVVLDRHPIAPDSRGPTITLGPPDVQAVQAALADNAPIAPVRGGQQVTQRDLIEWALVDSAANATWSLANWAFGSIDAFLVAADAFAAEYGLDKTDLADPSRLSPQSVSSAEDLANIALKAVGDPVVLATLQLESVTIPGIGYAPNTNRILGKGDVDGGKTGTLRVWGRNLLATATRDVDGRQQRVVAVVMGTITADDIDAQMLALVESLWDDFGERVVLENDTVVAEYETPWGARATATTTEDLRVYSFGNIVPTAVVSVAGVPADSLQQEVGLATVDFGGETLTAPVRTTGTIAEPEFAWRIMHASTVLGWYFED